MGENFIFGHCGLILFFLFTFDFGSVVLLPFLVFFTQAMFLWYFETAAKASSVLLLEDCCVKVRLVCDGFSFGGNSNLRNAFFGVDWSDSHSLKRKARQIQA
jgi:hypothetical protein